MRRSSSKPAYVYDLAPDAEELFPKAYDQVLDQLLEVLHEQMAPEQVEAVMRTTGHRLAAQWRIPSGDLHVRLEAAVDILNELGGLAELEQQNETYTIRGYSCPLVTVATSHPEVCCLASSMLTELVGVPVQDQCERDDRVGCRFVVPICPSVT
jgi:predicted ArsR family transcriptional regulator